MSLLLLFLKKLAIDYGPPSIGLKVVAVPVMSFDAVVPLQSFDASVQPMNFFPKVKPLT